MAVMLRYALQKGTASSETQLSQCRRSLRLRWEEQLHGLPHRNGDASLQACRWINEVTIYFNLNIGIITDAQIFSGVGADVVCVVW